MPSTARIDAVYRKDDLAYEEELLVPDGCPPAQERGTVLVAVTGEQVAVELAPVALSEAELHLGAGSGRGGHLVTSQLMTLLTLCAAVWKVNAPPRVLRDSWLTCRGVSSAGHFSCVTAIPSP